MDDRNNELTKKRILGRGFFSRQSFEEIDGEGLLTIESNKEDNQILMFEQNRIGNYPRGYMRDIGIFVEKDCCWEHQLNQLFGFGCWWGKGTFV
jgi:hypothetical protein